MGKPHRLNQIVRMFVELLIEFSAPSRAAHLKHRSGRWDQPFEGLVGNGLDVADASVALRPSM